MRELKAFAVVMAVLLVGLLMPPIPKAVVKGALLFSVLLLAVLLFGFKRALEASNPMALLLLLTVLAFSSLFLAFLEIRDSIIASGGGW